jgi:DNA polymerase III epsilon subunit-like protein
MAYIALDTETTGIPLNNCRDFRKIECFETCRPVSIAIVQYSPDHEELFRMHEYVYPDGYQVEATHIHGITHDMAVERGVPFKKIYDCLDLLLREVPYVVGHNIMFDINLLKSESLRRGFDMTILDTIVPVCTLKLTKEVLGKPMKLVELYQFLFDEPLVGAHGALADTLAAARVYQTLLRHKEPDRRELSVKRVIIKASEVAACIGKNPYKPTHEVMDDMWKKYSPETFRGFTKNDRAEAVFSTSPEAQSVLTTALANKPSNSDDVQTICADAMTRIKTNDSLSMSQKREAIDHIRSKVYTTFGTKSEDKTSDKIEVDENVKLIRDEKFYTIEVTNILGTSYVIVGKVDRIEEHQDGSRTLVEIKNRAAKLFNVVRPYEMIQVQTYLEMLNLDKARLVEQHNNQTASHPIARDTEMWKNVVVPRLVSFCERLHLNMCN